MWITTVGIVSLLSIASYAERPAEIDWYKYYQMPPIHHHDDFIRCMHPKHRGYAIFCDVHSIIKPDNTSELWNYIEEFTSDYKRHFAHDQINTGFCVELCEKKIGKLSPQEQEALYVPEFPWREKYIYDDSNFENVTENRKNHGKLLNQCFNLWLRENYNLTGYSVIQFCTDTLESERKAQYTTGQYLFLLVLAAIIAVISFAAYVDSKQNVDKTLAFYKEDREVQGNKKYLLCFSPVRNWYRLTSPRKTELGHDLRFLLASRYLTTFLVVLGHVFISQAFAPTYRPEYIEQTYYELEAIMTNGALTVVQSFFLTSGILLYLSFEEVLRPGQWNIKYFVGGFVYRYMRLTPVYAFWIFFQATWMYPLGEGSFWKPIAQVEEGYCKKNWWANLLYINNYVTPKEMCLIQSWYLAADTQLFTIALFLFAFMWRYPKYKKEILGFAFFIACAIHFYVVYINEYDGIYFMTPEVKRWLINNISDEFEKDYIATHSNMANFLIGVSAGIYYKWLKKTKTDYTSNKLLIFAWWILPILGFFILYIVTYIFIRYDFEKPSVWVALVSVATRVSWGLMCVLFFIGFYSRFKSPLKNFFHWSVFATLSRLTYCIYICHLTIQRFIFGGLDLIIDISTPYLLLQAVGVFALSNLLALILCLSLEFPLTAFAKELFRAEKATLDREKQREREGNNNGHMTKL